MVRKSLLYVKVDEELFIDYVSFFKNYRLIFFNRESKGDVRQLRYSPFDILRIYLTRYRLIIIYCSINH